MCTPVDPLDLDDGVRFPNGFTVQGPSEGINQALSAERRRGFDRAFASVQGLALLRQREAQARLQAVADIIAEASTVIDVPEEDGYVITFLLDRATYDAAQRLLAEAAE